jgi:MFS transporter, CP family, cyanate transporter
MTNEASRRHPTPVIPLAALLLAAVGLRLQLVGLGPLLPEIQEELGLSHGLGGLLGTAPVLCMAFFALPAVRLAHRIGLRTAMTVSLLAILLFGAVRPLADGFGMLLVLTIGVGIGIGLGGALLPRAVKAAVPSRIGFATGVYSAGIHIGAAVGAGVAASVAVVFDWRISLLVLAAASGVVLLTWLVLGRSIPDRDLASVRPVFPLRSLLAWRLLAIFALNSLCFYGLVTWLPSIYVEQGWTEVSAGGLVALLGLSGLPATVAIPWLSDRSRGRHGYVFAGGVATAIGVGGILLAPGLAVLWVTVTGLALGALFPLSMTLPIDAARRQTEIAGYAALMLTGGYATAAVGPALLGLLRDATGSFALPLWVLLGAAVVLCLFSTKAIGRSAA